MQRQLISSGSPFEERIGYSRAVAQGPFVFVSGTTGFDYATTTIAEDVAAQALAWARQRLGARPVLVYATAAPEAVKAVQAQLGAERAGALVEQALARVAAGLVEAGVGQLLVAGGETSGACVQALGVRTLRIGPQIDPGVPWCHATPPLRPGGLHLALKSGNFGGVDFFTRAFDRLG